jgi:hypothetical protein
MKNILVGKILEHITNKHKKYLSLKEILECIINGFKKYSR